MLSVDRLRVLHAIAAHGSLSAASQALHVTNSAVSQQLTKLEREVGQPLVERNGRGVRLTDAAELLVEHTSRILSLVHRAEADLEAHRGEVTGHLRLSATPTAVRGLLPTALPALREAHPALRVELQEEEPQESVPAMARGDILQIVVEVQPTAFSKYRVQFIGSGGKVLKEVAASSAAYDIRGDEGYVRAKVIESNGDVAWCQPVLVAQFEFLEWTEDNHLRHTKFIGLCDDKTAMSVTRDDENC